MTSPMIDTSVSTHLVGDCRALLVDMPERSVQTCVTSPPYWGLRDYGNAAQIGLEESPDKYIAELVDVFRLVRRALRDDGTLWLNLGDSYASGEVGRRDGFDVGHGRPTTKLPPITQEARATNRSRFSFSSGLKHKDLVGIPWRAAFALQADGWWLRSDIIWHKPNPIPESVTDRPTKAHEYVFLLAKSERYFYDAKALAEPSVTGVTGVTGGAYSAPGQTPHSNARGDVTSVETATRNGRSVWSIASRPFAGAHFATMPPPLVERCVLAGSIAGDLVLDPFHGSGTVGMVAETNGRRWIGMDLNPEYAELAKVRTSQTGLRFG